MTNLKAEILQLKNEFMERKYRQLRWHRTTESIGSILFYPYVGYGESKEAKENERQDREFKEWRETLFS